ncbi:hypothetical protein [Methanorbis rubei]|uniref:hypothetical protein n=1 Tax=Methanorbis rubei TaxID=3028300 RepID=UPI0030B886EF
MYPDHSLTTVMLALSDIKGIGFPIILPLIIVLIQKISDNWQNHEYGFERVFYMLHVSMHSGVEVPALPVLLRKRARRKMVLCVTLLRPRKNGTHAFGLLTASREHTEFHGKNITEQT